MQGEKQYITQKTNQPLPCRLAIVLQMTFAFHPGREVIFLGSYNTEAGMTSGLQAFCKCFC